MLKTKFKFYSKFFSINQIQIFDFNEYCLALYVLMKYIKKSNSLSVSTILSSFFESILQFSLTKTGHSTFKKILIALSTYSKSDDRLSNFFSLFLSILSKYFCHFSYLNFYLKKKTMRATRPLPPITSLFPMIQQTPMVFNIPGPVSIPQNLFAELDSVSFAPQTTNSTTTTIQPKLSHSLPIKSTTGKSGKSTIKCKFTAEEDKLLLEIASQTKVHNWNEIAQKVGTRNARQCRERWNNYLNPSLRNDPWTEEEDRLLIDLHAEYGTHWNKISKMFCNRSDNSIRNRWQLLMRHLEKRNASSSQTSSQISE